MGGIHLCCSECGTDYEEDRSLLVCPACAARQEPGRELRGILEVVLEELPLRWPPLPFTGFEFLTTFLPIPAFENVPRILVGGTPLLEVPRLREILSMPSLWIKDDTRNPSGSTKDRASFLVVAKAGEYEFDTVATASTGNAASALAAVAAAAGMRAVVFVPASVPPGKLAQMLNYGAEVVPVHGSYDEAFDLCQAACASFGWYNRNTALNPFTIEGKKTAALEIARQLGSERADAVIVPVGDGVILSGVFKGYRDLRLSGLVRRSPRLIAVQAECSAAIATAWREEAETITPVAGASSVADSLVVEAPRAARPALRALRESEGSAVIVGDEEILAAMRELAGSTGVFAEPAAAASLAGLRKALEEDLVDRDERVVLLVTGTGLKDVSAALRSAPAPEPVPAEIEAVARRLGIEKRPPEDGGLE